MKDWDINDENFFVKTFHFIFMTSRSYSIGV